MSKSCKRCGWTDQCDPTPDEIAERCREIQARWTHAVRLRRLGVRASREPKTPKVYQTPRELRDYLERFERGVER